MVRGGRGGIICFGEGRGDKGGRRAKREGTSLSEIGSWRGGVTEGFWLIGRKEMFPAGFINDTITNGGMKVSKSELGKLLAQISDFPN